MRVHTSLMDQSADEFRDKWDLGGGQLEEAGHGGLPLNCISLLAPVCSPFASWLHELSSFPLSCPSSMRFVPQSQQTTP